MTCAVFMSPQKHKNNKNKHGRHLWFTKFYYQLNIVLVYLQRLQCHSTLALNFSESISNIIHMAFILSMSAYRLYIITSALIKTYKDRGTHQQHTHVNTDWKKFYVQTSAAETPQH